MELKDGFKKTELGVIPSEWKITILEDLIDDSRSIRYGIVQPGKYDPNGRYMVRGQDYSFGWVSGEQMFRVSDTVESKYKNARLRAGDLVLTIVGASTGHLEEVPQWLTDANITQTTARIPIASEKANAKFCLYLLKSSLGQKQVANFIKGAAQPGLNIGDIRTFKLVLPPLSEQNLIATALSDMDALIAQTEKLIEKKKAIKQGVMQKLLSPVDENGKIKKGWVKKKLENLVDVNMGQSPNSKYYNIAELGLPLIQGNADIENRKQLIRNYTDVITKTCEPGDIVMTVRAPVGYVGLAIQKSCIGRGVCSLQLKKINKKFLYYLLVFKEPDWKALEQGSTFTSANGNQIKNFEVTIPLYEQEQERIATVISEIENEVDLILLQHKKLQLQKLGMMQCLLTGKIRIYKPNHEPATV